MYEVILIPLETFGFLLSYRVKANTRFARACFPSDKIYYYNIRKNNYINYHLILEIISDGKIERICKRIRN